MLRTRSDLGKKYIEINSKSKEGRDFILSFIKFNSKKKKYLKK